MPTNATHSPPRDSSRSQIKRKKPAANISERRAVCMKPTPRSYAGPPYKLRPTDLVKKGHRPIATSVAVQLSNIGDPKGGAQDAYRFSMRQDASSKDPGHASVGRFELDMSVFFGDFLDSRLRHSPFGPASPFAPQAAQCAKVKLPAQGAEALP